MGCFLSSGEYFIHILFKFLFSDIRGIDRIFHYYNNLVGSFSERVKFLEFQNELKIHFFTIIYNERLRIFLKRFWICIFRNFGFKQTWLDFITDSLPSAHIRQIDIISYTFLITIFHLARAYANHTRYRPLTFFLG